MTKPKEEKERIRKAYAPKGTRSQGRCGFRIDHENEDWLNQQPNKGRYLNELIKADRENRCRGEKSLQR